MLRDRDAKFTRAFDEVFRGEGVEVIRLPVRSPAANSFAERFVGTAGRECLDHLLIVSRRHLEYVLKEFVEHYQEARPHQGLDQRTPSGQPAVTPLAVGRIVRRLGGLGSTNTTEPPRDPNQGFLTAQGTPATTAARATATNRPRGELIL